MLRMLLGTLLGLSLTVMARADEAKADVKPQWQRLLTADDAKRAAELANRVGELMHSDRCAEAVKAEEELLALRERVQGTDHWQTVSEKWALAMFRQVAALPEQKRLGWAKAVE